MTQPAGTASKTAVRCVECRNQGKTRDFRTASGFLGHLRRYHSAKETDGVVREPKNG